MAPFSLPESFMLQYLDEKFSNYFTLDDDAEIKHLMSIKVVSTVAVVDESTPSCTVQVRQMQTVI